jgi:hypothetical protein
VPGARFVTVAEKSAFADIGGKIVSCPADAPRFTFLPYSNHTLICPLTPPIADFPESVTLPEVMFAACFVVTCGTFAASADPPRSMLTTALATSIIFREVFIFCLELVCMGNVFLGYFATFLIIAYTF